MGEVWLADHVDLDTPVTVELMSPALLGDKTARARFRREARATARLRSPHVVTIHDFGQDGDVPYLGHGVKRGSSFEPSSASASPRTRRRLGDRPSPLPTPNSALCSRTFRRFGFIIRPRPTSKRTTLDGRSLPSVMNDAELELDPGEHVFETLHARGSRSKVMVQLSEGRRRVPVVLSSPSAVDPGPAPAPGVMSGARSTSFPTRKVVGYSALGLGALGVTIGAVTGLIAKSRSDSLRDDDCDSAGDCYPRARAKADAAATWAAASTVSFIFGGSFLAAGAGVLLLTAFRERLAGEPRRSRAVLKRGAARLSALLLAVTEMAGCGRALGLDELTFNRDAGAPESPTATACTPKPNAKPRTSVLTCAGTRAASRSPTMIRPRPTRSSAAIANS